MSRADLDEIMFVLTKKIFRIRDGNLILHFST